MIDHLFDGDTVIAPRHSRFLSRSLTNPGVNLMSTMDVGMIDEFLTKDITVGATIMGTILPRGWTPVGYVSWVSWIPKIAWIEATLCFVLLAIVALVMHLIAKRYIVRLASAVMRRLPGWWMTEVVEQNVLYRLVPLVPVLIIGRGVKLLPQLAEPFVEMVARMTHGLSILFVSLAIGAVLNVGNAIYNRYPIAQNRPIKGYLQVVKLLLYLTAVILMVAALMGKSPWFFITGLGAMTAIILLVFRDTLLSLVAGIQLVNNDLIRVGDWIEMPQFNADGDVIDISLNVVQVRNWDKTITSIPTHKFLDHSFKNWRGMFDVGGRRISRTLNIDITTIRFLTANEVSRFGRFRLLKDHIAKKIAELEHDNQSSAAEDDVSIAANARHLTNIGTFRAYILAYLEQHPMVHQEFTTLVRQQEPGPYGLPLQIWTHIKDTRWIPYENAQSDIFDHLLAVAPEFGLRIFQNPTGHDFKAMAANL